MDPARPRPPPGVAPGVRPGMPPARPQGGPGMAPGAGPRPPGQPGAPLPMPGSAPQRPMPMAPGGARPVGGLPGPGHAAPAARAATQPAYPTAPGQVPLGLQPRPAAPAPAPNQAYANGAPPHSQQPTGASPVYQQPSPQQWTQPSPQPSPLQPAPPSQLASQMSGLSISGADGFGQQHAAQSLPGASGPGPAPSSFGAPMGMAAQQQPMMGAPQSMPAGPPAPMPGQFAAMPRPSSRPKRVYAGAPQPGAAVPQPGAAYPGQAMPGQQIPGAQQFQQPDGAGLPAAPAPGFGPTMGMPPNMPGMDSSIQQPPFYNAMPQPAVSPLQQAQMIAATQPSAAAPVQTGPRPGISPKSAAPPNAPRPRIDPNQIPSPVTVQELDQKTYDGQIWSTASRTLPPLASSEVRISDDGNASPRFMRITTYNIPTTEDIANQSHLPVGLVIQPFAQPRYDEDPILVVDLGESGPIRCHRCRGYINSGVKFVDGGQKWTCNLCDFNNEVPPEYFANLDMTGRRVDHDARPELRYGTVEFVPTKEYFSRPALPAAYVFALDVSWNAIQSGMLGRFCSTLKGFLYEGEGLPKGCQVGIITFDRSVQFYNLSSSLDQAHMMVVADVMDVFAPLNEGFLADPVESRSIIEGLLDNLPTMFAASRQSEAVLGAAVQAALAAMKDRGGKLSIFQTMLASHGPHPLKARDETKLLNTDKEKSLYEPQDAAWKKMASQSAEAGVSVDLYVFPNTYVDIATVGLLSAMTGGNSHLYQQFDDNRDGFKFANDLVRNLQRPFAFDVVARVRASNGLRISEHHGNFYMKNVTDLEFAGIDSSKAFAVTLKYDGKLDEKVESAFQCAMLYTAATGERRIRVSTLMVPASATMANIFRMADMDTTINYLAKTGVSMTASYPLRTIRDEFTVKCTKILAAYRKHCGSSTAPGQLILPESFKLFPVYALSLLKMKAFRGGQEVPSDVRVFHFRTLKSMGVPTSIPLVYPRMFAVHEMPEEAGQYSETGRFIFPPGIRCALERMEVDGAYVLENGFQLFLWIGRQIDPAFLRDVFGVDSVDQVSPLLRALPDRDNPRSKKIRDILAHVQNQRVNFLQLQIVRHQVDPFLEVEYNNMLVEDKNQDNATYVDFLCNVHRQIQVDLSN